MKVYVKWISKEGKKSIALAAINKFGMYESQGAAYGFVSVTAEDKAACRLLMENGAPTELPDTAVIVMKDTTKADGTKAQVPVWVW